MNDCKPLVLRAIEVQGPLVRNTRMERYLIGSKHDTPILGSTTCMCVAREHLRARNTLLGFPSQSVTLATIRSLI